MRTASNVVTRRSILAAAVSLAAGSALAACGAGQQSNTSTGSAPAAKPVTLRFQDWPGDFQDMVEKVAIPAFQAKNPSITVTYTAYTGDWVPKTLAEMIAGTAPDVLHVFSTTTREFA